MLSISYSILRIPNHRVSLLYKYSAILKSAYIYASTNSTAFEARDFLIPVAVPPAPGHDSSTYKVCLFTPQSVIPSAVIAGCVVTVCGPSPRSEPPARNLTHSLKVVSSCCCPYYPHPGQV